MCHTCRCIIKSTAVSLFVYSLVGGGTHDTYVPPKKQLYRYLFIRAKRVSNCYIEKIKTVICACGRLISVLVGGRQTVYDQNTVYLCQSKYVPPVDAHVYDSMIPGTYYVPDTYVHHLPLYY